MLGAEQRGTPMNIFCSLSGVVKLVLFWLIAGVVIGVSLVAPAAAKPVDSGRCSVAVAGPHPTHGVSGYREEVSGWNLTTT
jgi:hypothetical protein